MVYLLHATVTYQSRVLCKANGPISTIIFLVSHLPTTMSILMCIYIERESDNILTYRERAKFYERKRIKLEILIMKNKS